MYNYPSTSSLLSSINFANTKPFPISVRCTNLIKSVRKSSKNYLFKEMKYISKETANKEVSRWVATRPVQVD